MLQVITLESEQEQHHVPTTGACGARHVSNGEPSTYLTSLEGVPGWSDVSLLALQLTPQHLNA